MIEIKVDQLTKVFGRHPKNAMVLLEEGKSKAEILEETGMTVGVNQASFEIKKGEIFVIMGLSGSGKSTLVRLLNRLMEPTSGKVWVGDDNVIEMDKNELRNLRRKRMSMVFQNFALLPHKTILENAEFGLEIQGLAKDERSQRAKQSLEMVGLGAYLDKYPTELSGGMQQRVGLARALTNDPDILLMDEAFSALDPLIRKDMQDELLDLHQSVGKTIVFITHDLDEALRIGDRIALMNDGAIVQVDTAENILMRPADDYVKRFVEDVDMAKVFTAAHIMKRAENVMPDHGPRVALEIMREAGISTVYVVDRGRKLLGYITANQATKAVREQKRIEDVMHTELSTVSQDTLLTELFDSAATSDVPLAVVDDDYRLQGIVVKGAIMGALAGDNRVIHTAGEETAEEVTSS